MVDPSRIQFPKINKVFFRGIFFIIVFLFLATIFSSARGIYDVFLRKPEVRKETIQLGNDVYRGNEIWIQRAVIIHNRGNDDAKNVQINCLIPNGEITKLKVISEEEYLASDSESQPNVGAYSLPRLAAGSKLIILMWATVSTAIVDRQEPIMPIVSASFDGGVAISSDKPTALEEMQGIGGTLTKGVGAILQQLDNKIQINTAFQHLSSIVMPAWGIYFDSRSTIIGSEFKSALLASLMMMVIGWLILPRVWAGLFIAALFSLLVWLFVEFWVATIWLIVPLVLGFIALFTTRSWRESLVLIICLASLMLLIFFNITGSELSCLFENNFSTSICTLSLIHGGVFLGYALFTLYLIFVEL